MCAVFFKQHFARGQTYSYDLADQANTIAFILSIAHVDRVMPGLVHQIDYDRLVDDTVTEITSALGYLGLSFEDEVLEFYRNPRAVRTAAPNRFASRSVANRRGTGFRSRRGWVHCAILGDLAQEDTSPY